MSLMRSFVAGRSLRTPTFAPTLKTIRSFTSSPPRATSTGYGDPPEEKAANETPTPSSTADPQPGGQGKGPGKQSGTTDPEVGNSSGTGSAGGKKGAGSAENEAVTGKEIRETKKVGEEPKKEEVGGAGPIGG